MSCVSTPDEQGSAHEVALVQHDSDPPFITREPCQTWDETLCLLATRAPYRRFEKLREIQSPLSGESFRVCDAHRELTTPFLSPISLIAVPASRSNDGDRLLVFIMTNTTLIAIGVVIPLTILIGCASTFIWLTERKRKQNTVVTEIPQRPRIANYFTRDKDRYSTRIEDDGIEVCSPRPSISKPEPPIMETKAEYELPSLQIDETRTDSAVQSPTDTFDVVSELEGTMGRQPFKCPSKAKLRHSSDEHYLHAIARKELPNRASLQPQDHYQQRHSLQPITTTNQRDRVASNKSNKEALELETRDGSNSPTISAISELSGRARSSARGSDVPGEYLKLERSGGLMADILGEMPAWIKRMSVQEMVEKNWKVDGEIATPEDPSKERTGFL